MVFSVFKRKTTELEWWSTPSHTLHSFILFTFLQILVFLFRPQLYSDAAPDMDVAPTFAAFRLIGIQECGLVLVYCAIAYTNDHTLMKMTVLGRLTVIPFSCMCVFYLGAPWTMLFGIIQDVSFGLWTYWSLNKVDSRNDNTTQRTTVSASGTLNTLTRLTIAAAGLLCAYGGYLGLSGQLDQQPLFYFMHSSTSTALGLRSVALIYFLVGCYHIGIGTMNAHPYVFLSCGLYHGSVIVVFALMQAWRNDLRAAYHIPSLHFICAPVLLLLSVCTCLVAGPHDATGTATNIKKSK